MKTSQKGIELIKKHESKRLTAYLCPSGVPTIGYGHTRNVQMGKTITDADADRLLEEDLSYTESVVGRLVKKPLTQNQFDALVSFVFNVGEGNFAGSTLLTIINRDPNNIGIKPQFERWIYGSGQVLPGLVTRRRDEAALYLSKL